jgi:hypothetical protein
VNHSKTTTFWLDGALQISALEQVEFLKRERGLAVTSEIDERCLSRKGSHKIMRGFFRYEMDAEMHMHSPGVQGRATVIRIDQREISGQW